MREIDGNYKPLPSSVSATDQWHVHVQVTQLMVAGPAPAVLSTAHRASA